jgi:hypothetical protein
MGFWNLFVPLPLKLIMSLVMGFWNLFVPLPLHMKPN